MRKLRFTSDKIQEFATKSFVILRDHQHVYDQFFCIYQPASHGFLIARKTPSFKSKSQHALETRLCIYLQREN